MKAIRYALLLNAFVVSLLAQHSSVPVVLVDGFNSLGCASSPRNDTANFGSLRSILAEDSGSQPFYYDYCAAAANASIDQIGADFGRYLSALGLPQVDVVAYSMGGLIVRSYLSGLNLSNNTVTPVIAPPIRKLVLIATPNFGAMGKLAGLEQVLKLFEPQGPEMLPGTQLIWDLNTWNQGGDDLRGLDTVAIAGSGDPQYQSDGIVSINSASVSFAFADGDLRTRVIPYCHLAINLNTLLGCNGPGLAYVSATTHLSYQIIRSFLDGTNVWQTIGVSASQASSTGGILWGGIASAANVGLAAGTPVLTNSAVKMALSGGSAAWYQEFFPASSATLDFTLGGQPWEIANLKITPGSYWALNSKFGPAISSWGILPAAAIPPGARSVAADSLITIYGGSLSSSTASSPYPWPTQLSDTTVSIDGLACPLSYASPGQVNALVPSSLSPGLHGLTLKTSQGQHSLNLMIESAVPALFSLPGNAAAALHLNYQVISASNPAAVGEYIALYATGLGAVTLQNGLEVVKQTPSVYIGGQPATVTFAGRSPGFQGLDQINVQIPAGVGSGASVPVIVISGNRASNVVAIAVR